MEDFKDGKWIASHNKLTLYFASNLKNQWWKNWCFRLYMMSKQWFSPRYC